MKELRAIVKAYQDIDFNIRKAALATVVKVHGSSYRSPGARMIITDDGKWIGSISGGCLEGDALRKSRQVMNDKKPITITYDTREESNQNLGIGLGCNGVIDVLIEAIEPNEPDNIILLLNKVIHSDTPIACASVYTSDLIGQKIFLSVDNSTISTVTDDALKNLIIKDLIEVFETKKSHSKKYNCNSEAEVFLELIQPSVNLIIFGGGFDARPVSELAKSLGWKVNVTDECVAHIAPIFFPGADKLSLCHREFIGQNFNITPYTACVLMSHNYEYDRDVLRKIIDSSTPYIGILGPRKRFDKMVAEFALAGLTFDADQLHKIHSPIGLDIGAETPDEIALSIVAEIQSKFSNRHGGSLKYRNAPIHQRDLESDQVFKQFYISGQKTRKAAGKN